MSFILTGGLRLMVSVLFIVGLIGPQLALLGRTASVSPNNAQDTYLYITFSGLVVFDKQVRDSEPGDCGLGKQKIWLLSQAEHHEVTIQIKGPQFEDEFIDWGHHYEKDQEMKLDVMNIDGCDAGLQKPTWPGARPYQIALLHPVTDGQLVRRPEQFGPTLTINSGVFNGDHLQTIKFESDANPTGSEVPRIPRLISARITLSPNQKAVLSANHGLPPVEMRGGPWEIRVRNNPDIGSACRDDHFKCYYDGFGLLKDGAVNPVADRMRYKALALGTPSCKEDKKILPTRPCIPISN